MWLDLLLTYTKYYRYRVFAFTQTGVNGSTSTPTANSIKPNKAGTNDIVAYAITADLLAANSVYTNALQAGAIIASKIATGTITALQIAAGTITADKLNVTTLSAITANLGTITAGVISGTRFNIGAGTDEDIYFMDSGIRLYDGGSAYLRFYKSGVGQFTLNLTSGAVRLMADGYMEITSSVSPTFINVVGKNFYFYSAGFFKLPTIASAPSAAGMAGSLIWGNNRLHVVSTTPEIRYILSSSGW
jgi:hypothetical protein